MLPYKNKNLAIEQRIADLLSRMTIEEKAGQLNQLNGGEFTGPAQNDLGQQEKIKAVKDGLVGSMLNVIGTNETKSIQKIAIEKSRLGIPLLFAYDVIHGYKTIFPIPLAEACSWNLQQIEKNASVAAMEASSSGIHWAFAPMCDLSNDPRWGRVMEGIGEDPWYGGLLAEARVKGLQGDFSENNVIACVKHFAAYGLVEAGKEYNITDVSRTNLWNKYLPPYKKAIEAGALTVMNGFNTLDGIPVSANSYLITDILKQKWNFDGFIVSDWNSFGEMITWGYAANEEDAAYKAFTAGAMMDMESKIMFKYIPKLINEEKISVKELDDAVYRILMVKFKLGLFDHPYKYANTKKEQSNILTENSKFEALKSAQECIVLLKNENKTLPIQKNNKIALIGALANSKADIYDFWIAQANHNQAVTLKEGLENQSIPHSYCKGYQLDGTFDDKLIHEALEMAKNTDVIVVNLGISGQLAGEDRSLANPIIPPNQIELVKILKQTGKPIIAIITSGRPLILTDLMPHVDAVLYTWILGIESGNAITNVLLGAYNPSAKTVMTFPYSVGQIPIYYNHYNTGRPIPTDGAGGWYSRYRDTPREPLFPFGFGLSYTEFEYKDIQINKKIFNKNEDIKVSVIVSNIGEYNGTELVQLYIRDIAASIIRPVKELKGFQRVNLNKSESKEICFTLNPNDLSFYNHSGDLVLEAGFFELFIGTNANEVLKTDFELKF